MLERPFAADLLAVTSLIKSSVNEPYMANAKKVLMKEERIMYAEYSKAIKMALAVRGINSHIILSRAWKISSLGFTRLVIKEGLLYMNMPINRDATAEASTIKDISSTLCPIEVR